MESPSPRAQRRDTLSEKKVRNPLPFSCSGRTPRQLPVEGETFPGQIGALATYRAPAAFLAAACPGTRWRKAAAALARGSGLGAPGWRPGLGRPRAAPLWIAPRCVRPVAWSPGDAGGSCSGPPARPPAPPPNHRSVPPSLPCSLPSPNLLPFSLQSPPPPLPWRPP